MELKGKIILALPEVSGVSARTGNAWKKREYVLETVDTQYPRNVHFTCFGDNADKIRLEVGQTVTISFDLESREFNGRWYTDVRVWKAEIAEGASTQPVQPTDANRQGVTEKPEMPKAEDEEFPF